MRVLTVDDSRTILAMLHHTLSNAGFEVLQAEDGQKGLDVLASEQVDVVITDINMPKLDGYGVIQHMRERPEYDDMPILVLTTESDNEKKERARKLGATGFIIKPFNPDDLEHTVQKAIEHKRLVSENKSLRTKIDELNLAHEIVGTSPATRRLLEQVAMVSASDTTVLIRG